MIAPTAFRSSTPDSVLESYRVLGESSETDASGRRPFAIPESASFADLSEMRANAPRRALTASPVLPVVSARAPSRELRREMSSDSIMSAGSQGSDRSHTTSHGNASTNHLSEYGSGALSRRMDIDEEGSGHAMTTVFRSTRPQTRAPHGLPRAPAEQPVSADVAGLQTRAMTARIEQMQVLERVLSGYSHDMSARSLRNLPQGPVPHGGDHRYRNGILATTPALVTPHPDTMVEQFAESGLHESVADRTVAQRRAQRTLTFAPRVARVVRNAELPNG